MPEQPSTERMLNLSAISRRLDIPYSRLYRLVQAGRLQPDATAGNVYLFHASSVGRVERALAHLFPHGLHNGAVAGRMLRGEIPRVSQTVKRSRCS